MTAKELALALREAERVRFCTPPHLNQSQRVIDEVLAYLDEQAKYDGQKALALATIDEWEKWGKQDSAGTLLRVKAALTDG